MTSSNEKLAWYEFPILSTTFEDIKDARSNDVAGLNLFFKRILNIESIASPAPILRLVGVEYDLQKKEAAYRKILVIAEDDGTVRPKTIEELFDGVRSIHFLSYIRYLYFNIGRIAYLQANVLSAYVFLAPAIVAGAVTLGVMQQIIRAFG